jgi:hypothetical protein
MWGDHLVILILKTVFKWSFEVTTGCCRARDPQ